MAPKTLAQAANDMLDAVKQLSTAQGIDWSDPVYEPVAKAHADLTESLIHSQDDGAIDWSALRESVGAAGFFVSKAAPDAPEDYLWDLIRKVYSKVVRTRADGQRPQL